VNFRILHDPAAFEHHRYSLYAYLWNRACWMLVGQAATEQECHELAQKKRPEIPRIVADFDLPDDVED
jgi:hypothetical protein